MTDYSQLNVYSGPERPDLSNMEMYQSDILQVMGNPVICRIIGSSHFINMPELSYREITSCRPIEFFEDFRPVTMNYDITDGIDDVLIRTVDGYRVEITIQTRTYAPPYDTDNWDIHYVFGPDESGAPTAIRNAGTGWETIHTYPEYETELYTRTDLFRLD